MEVKYSAKWKVLTITDRKGYTLTATTTKQNKQNNWIYTSVEVM